MEGSDLVEELSSTNTPDLALAISSVGVDDDVDSGCGLQNKEVDKSD